MDQTTQTNITNAVTRIVNAIAALTVEVAAIRELLEKQQRDKLSP